MKNVVESRGLGLCMLCCREFSAFFPLISKFAENLLETLGCLIYELVLLLDRKSIVLSYTLNHESYLVTYDKKDINS